MERMISLKLLRWLDLHLEETICAVLMIFFVLLCNFQVLTRYAFTSINVPWTEEIARYSFIFSMYVALSWTIRVDNTLKVEILKMLLPKKGQLVQEILTGLVVIVTAAVLLNYSWAVYMKQVNMGQLLPASGIPIAWVWLSYPLAFILTILRSIQRIVMLIKKGV